MIDTLEFKNLKDKKYRRVNGLFLVEGEKFCRDIRDAGVEVVYTFTSDEKLVGFDNINVVSEKKLSSLATTKTNQNIVCVCKARSVEIDSVGNSLILDNVQDPGNVGTLIRSALAFGFNDIYLVGGADVYSEKVIRSSAGLSLTARLHVVDFDSIVKNKRKIASKFFVADMKGENLNKICLPKEKFAVIIGSEGQGVSKQFLEFADQVVSIPMKNGIESLNAGVAGSIIMQRFSEVDFVRT